MQNVDPAPATEVDQSSTVYDNLEVEIIGVRVKVDGPTAVIRALNTILPLGLTAPKRVSSPTGIHFDVRMFANAPGYYVISRQAYLPIVLPFHQAIPYLDQAINAALLAQLHDYYLIHAGAVALGETGIIFPASAGSGKTTFVAGCVAEGFHYLSDEVAVVDPGTGNLLPLAKSMYVREGAREILASVYPPLKESSEFVQPSGERVWYLPPRLDWLPSFPTKVRAVVLPTFRSDLPTSLDPVGRSEVLRCVMEQSFNLDQHRGKGLGSLVRLLGEAECYRLTYRDWREGVAEVRNRLSR